MADNIAEIRKLFTDNGVPLVREDVWAVQGVAVVKHKALERLAAALKVRWQEPKILRAERDEAVILVTGAIGDHAEWSIGEALVQPFGSSIIGNYLIKGKMAAYPFAMAEKRGKDRVIIKLAGIDAYSEEESDDFKDRGELPAVEPLPRPIISSGTGPVYQGASLGTDSGKQSPPFSEHNILKSSFTGPVDMREPTPEGIRYLQDALNAVAALSTEKGLMSAMEDATKDIQRLLTTEQAGVLRRAVTARRAQIRSSKTEAAE